MQFHWNGNLGKRILNWVEVTAIYPWDVRFIEVEYFHLNRQEDRSGIEIREIPVTVWISELCKCLCRLWVPIEVVYILY